MAISARGRPIHFMFVWFYGGVFGVGGSNGAISGLTKFNRYVGGNNAWGVIRLVTVWSISCFVCSEWQFSCSKRPIKETIKLKVFISRQIPGAETSRPKRGMTAWGSKKLPQGISRRGNWLEDYITDYICHTSRQMFDGNACQRILPGHQTDATTSVAGASVAFLIVVMYNNRSRGHAELL